MVGGLLCAAGLPALLAGAHALNRAEAPRPEETVVRIVADAQETESGRWRTIGVGEFGRSTLVADTPPPEAGSVVRATLDWWGEDIAGIDDVQVVGVPAAQWQVRSALRTGLRDAAGVGAHPGADLLPGLVIGDVAHVDAELTDAMRTVSLTHLTAVSGSNILIVAGVVVFLCARLRSPWWVRILPAAAVTAGYVFVVGPEPSVMRATAMAALVAVGLLRPAGTPTLAVLSSAVTVLLLVRPHLATEIGFGLSVCATAAIVMLAPPLTRALTDRRVPRLIAVAIAVPTAAQLGCTPLLVVMDPRMSPWAVLANVAAAPAVAPATVLGLAGLAGEGVATGLTILAEPAAGSGSRAGAAVVFHIVARSVGAMGAAAAWWITVVARVCAVLPGAGLGWPAGAAGVAVAVGLAVGVACALLGRRSLRGVGAVTASACLVAGLAAPVLTATGRGSWSAIVCDVGQGSAALFRSRDGPRDHALLVDTGDDPAKLASCMEGAGISRLTIALSHFDSDHVAALPEAVASVDEALVIHPLALDGTADAARTRQSATVAPPVSAGQEIPSDLLPTGVTVDVLWPPPDARSADDGNAASLVLLVTVDGLRVLLPGDVGEAQQLRLVADLAHREPIDVLVAPHHGSADTSPAFFRAARPRVGVVSVGADNTYGHPTARALDAYGSVPVLRTDRCGSVSFSAELTLLGDVAETCVPHGR
nr:ComEC/Rec2 family competence protein [Brevibacterium yomogidense]